MNHSASSRSATPRTYAVNASRTPRNRQPAHAKSPDGHVLQETRCAQCGAVAVIPFTPKPGQTIYCSDCHRIRQSTGPVGTRMSRHISPDLAVRQDGPQQAVQSFDQLPLSDTLQRALADAGFTTPTPVQAEAIPVALAGRDLVGSAQTGTGKTVAFVLPILQRLLETPKSPTRTRAIILTPTRELAEQIHTVFEQLARYTAIRSATVYGGVGMRPQELALRGSASVIIACPGRLLDHIDRGNTRLDRVSMLVLDEADQMLDMGFLPSIRRILAELPDERQSMFFSATFAPALNTLAEEALNNPARVAVDLCAPPAAISHALYPCPHHLKTALLLHLLEQADTGSVLVFTRTKHRASRLTQQLNAAGYDAAELHANRSQSQRQAALDSFRTGRCQFLVATDIAARGIDVASVSHVVNYDIPDTADTYIHRVGRTGRMARAGDAITFMTPQDRVLVRSIESMMGQGIEQRRVSTFDYNVPVPVGDGSAQRPDGGARRTRSTDVIDRSDRPAHAGASMRRRTGGRGDRKL